MASTPPDTSGDVAEQDRLDVDRLAGWMREHVAWFDGPLAYAKFVGGQSNPTYRLDAGGKPYVLRRKPFGPLLPSAHAVEREYTLIAGLYPTGFPVPRPYGLCEDAGVIGAPFYVMELVGGRTIWDGTMPGLSAAQRTEHYHAMVDTLAALHATDHAAAGLSDYGKPGNYFARQVSRWTRQYRAAETERMPAIEHLIDWLPRTLPEQTRTSIVHGDYRVDNMIFAADAGRVAALLDWELSTLGDPLADLTYFLMSWVTQPEGRSGVMGRTGPETGIPTMAAMVERYCAATGRDGVARPRLVFRLQSVSADRHRPGHQEAGGTRHRVERPGRAVGSGGASPGRGRLELRATGGGLRQAVRPERNGARHRRRRRHRWRSMGMARFEGKSVIVTGAGSGIGAPPRSSSRPKEPASWSPTVPTEPTRRCGRSSTPTARQRRSGSMPASSRT